MATGALPFRGDTSALVFNAILERQPTPPIRLNPDLPSEMERIVNKSLEKDRNLRYQHAADMRADLQRLKRDTDTSRAVAAASSGSVPVAHESVSTPAAQPPASSSSAAALASIPSSSSVKVAAVAPDAPRKLWKIAAPVAVLLLAIGAGFFFYSRRSQAMTEKDSILLTDFVNTTGDGVFDGTLKQALAVQLEQSPYLNVLPQSRIQGALRLMGRPPDERVTSDVAREICVREGVKAMLTGSISPTG